MTYRYLYVQPYQLVCEFIRQQQLRAAGWVIDDLQMNVRRTHSEVSPQRFDDRFFGGETPGNEGGAIMPLAHPCQFRRTQDSTNKAVAEPLHRATDADHIDYVYSNRMRHNVRMIITASEHN